MTNCFILNVLAVVLTACNSCSIDRKFGSGYIDDVKLNAKESQELIVQLSNGIYKYCRTLNLQSGKLTFEETPCDKDVLEWSSWPDYDISISLPYAEIFNAFDEESQMVWMSNVQDTELSVTIEGSTTTILLEDAFIHPNLYSYFYSASMKTLFILTADREQNQTDSATDDSMIDLVAVSWNPTDSTSDAFPADLNDFAIGFNEDIENNFVGTAVEYSGILALQLDRSKWAVYDSDEMFLLQVNTTTAKPCYNERRWLRYSFIADIYSNANATMYFDYVGEDYMGVDSRLKRAYGFNDNQVWFYEVDNEGLEEFRVVPFVFEESQLSTYWVFMWVGIGVVVFCLCCCCWVCLRRKRFVREEGGMTREQQIMTQV